LAAEAVAGGASYLRATTGAPIPGLESGFSRRKRAGLERVDMLIPFGVVSKLASDAAGGEDVVELGDDTVPERHPVGPVPGE
jgi:hypothetical protein